MNVKKIEKQVKEVDVVVENYTLCDKCNERIYQELHDAFDFELSLKTGSAFSDSGYGERQEIDLCRKCANELISNLKSDGYRVNESEWDY
jgi:hypothetical protein